MSCLACSRKVLQIFLREATGIALPTTSAPGRLSSVRHHHSLPLRPQSSGLPPDPHGFRSVRCSSTAAAAAEQEAASPAPSYPDGGTRESASPDAGGASAAEPAQIDPNLFTEVLTEFGSEIVAEKWQEKSKERKKATPPPAPRPRADQAGPATRRGRRARDAEDPFGAEEEYTTRKEFALRRDIATREYPIRPENMIRKVPTMQKEFFDLEEESRKWEKPPIRKVAPMRQESSMRQESLELEEESSKWGKPPIRKDYHIRTDYAPRGFTVRKEFTKSKDDIKQRDTEEKDAAEESSGGGGGSALRRLSQARKNLEPWQVQKEALKKKFGDEGWNPRKKLSPDAMEGIRALHAQFPDTLTTPVLAEQFKVSPEVIRRILKADRQWSDEEYERRLRRWERRGERIWSHQVELGVRPPKKWREMGVGKAPPGEVPKWKWRARRRLYEEQQQQRVAGKGKDDIPWGAPVPEAEADVEADAEVDPPLPKANWNTSLGERIL